MKTKLIVAALACCVATTAIAEGAHGKIKICRAALPGASTAAVYVPADGTYSPACDSEQECRKFVVGVTAGAMIPAGVGTCASLSAVVLQDDGQPITVGQSLVANWATGSMVSHTKVIEAFK